MNIEKDDYFVVTKGFELGDTSFIDAAFGVATIPKTQRWDRSHEGCIFVALEVCGPVIACECVWFQDESPFRQKVGKRHSLNTNEVEVWPVTKQYLESVKGASK